jgi:hypothetical protein
MWRNDYYPGGSLMPGRSFNSNTYRYGGAGGQEMDNEVSGVGNSYTAHFWQYDPRLLRRWNTDPITYPWQSVYAVNNNNPIIFTDPLGLFGTRKEARQFRRNHKDQFKNGHKIGKGVDASGNDIFVLQRRGDGQQFAFGAGTAGYSFGRKKSRNNEKKSIDLYSFGINYLNNQMKYSYKDAERMIVEEKGYDFELYTEMKKLDGFEFPEGSNGTSHAEDYVALATFLNDYAKKSSKYKEFAGGYMAIMFSNQSIGEKVKNLRALVNRFEVPHVTQNEIESKFYELNPGLKYLKDE